MRPLFALVSAALLGAASAAQAQAQPLVQDLKGSRIQLEARATEEVDNDIMRAVLFVEQEESDGTQLADKVNQVTNEALKLAKSFGGLRTRTSGYSTYPVTVKDKIVRWRARSEITVEGEDFQRMAQAIGKLQGIMQLASVDFSVSPARRASVEDVLTQSAIADFLRKAKAATKGFGGSKFRVLEAAISGDGGGMPPPRPMVMMKSAEASDSVVPGFESGRSRITVNVNGAILIPR